MSEAWTDALVEPLATVLRGRPWKLIRDAPGGGWFALASGAAPWFRISPESVDLAPLSPLEDERLAPLRPTLGEALRRGAACRVLSWRPGKRAVLRFEEDGRYTVVKVYRRMPLVAERWGAFAEYSDPEWSVPRIDDIDIERGTLTMEDCAGRTLHRRWLEGDGRSEDGDRVARLLRWIASRPVPGALPTHGAAEEIAVLERRVEQYARTLRRPRDSVRRLAERVCEALDRAPTAPEVTVHRDLYDKQILFEGQRGRLLDLDLVARGPAALDVGNVVAHLRLRHLTGAPVPWEAIAERIFRGAPEPLDRETLRPWIAAPLMRLALIYARRNRPPGLLAQLENTVENVLSATGPWKKLLEVPLDASA